MRSPTKIFNSAGQLLPSSCPALVRETTALRSRWAARDSRRHAAVVEVKLAAFHWARAKRDAGASEEICHTGSSDLGSLDRRAQQKSWKARPGAWLAELLHIVGDLNSPKPVPSQNYSAAFLEPRMRVSPRMRPGQEGRFLQGFTWTEEPILAQMVSRLVLPQDRLARALRVAEGQKLV